MIQALLSRLLPIRGSVCPHHFVFTDYQWEILRGQQKFYEDLGLLMLPIPRSARTEFGGLHELIYPEGTNEQTTQQP